MKHLNSLHNEPPRDEQWQSIKQHELFVLRIFTQGLLRKNPNWCSPWTTSVEPVSCPKKNLPGCSGLITYCIVLFLLVLEFLLGFWFDIPFFWCAADLSLKSPMVACQKARQRTASRPWWRLQALTTRRKSHGRTSISSCRTMRRSCSLLN